jgi:hypothetical protein
MLLALTCFTKKDMPLSVTYRDDDAQPDDPRPLLFMTLPAPGTSASIHSAMASFALYMVCFAHIKCAVASMLRHIPHGQLLDL